MPWYRTCSDESECRLRIHLWGGLSSLTVAAHLFYVAINFLYAMANATEIIVARHELYRSL
ncbi:hypothetical protein BGW80DRAFT_1445482 [Lactifluus volemus]|nr:hypothetical protein BGW80DRAFT_1445482 [Lactifluus volemus]